ncbi:MAG TPA: tRNA (adenosine(37)-N6)-threonylcarbamoyltransferase complex ATPase subunit type 1 TsaE [Mycobacteriales bacterium]|nr:tRNA (adenosine(37)-N6)-threonylcarbamoyltransferase complex ATPase subunit type 1 TsaE [Mycobacteriales bacterium]
MSTPEQMHELGRRIASRCLPGDLVLLTGPLGSGKTVLAQGIGAELGVRGPVTSPTFVIARVHRGGRLPLVHVDAYRLASVGEVDDLDLDAELEDSLTVVEWGAGLTEMLADAFLEVKLARRPDDEVRMVQICTAGTRWSAADLEAISDPPGLPLGTEPEE